MSDETILDLAALQRQVEARVARRMREQQTGSDVFTQDAPLLTTIVPDGMPSLLRKVK